LGSREIPQKLCIHVSVLHIFVSCIFLLVAHNFEGSIKCYDILIFEIIFDLFALVALTVILISLLKVVNNSLQ